MAEKMSNSPVKKPFNIFHWFVLGVVSGIPLGIIICLVINIINLVRTEWPNGPPSWEVIKWGLSRAAFVCAIGGAAIGGFVGFAIGAVRARKE